MTFNMLPGRRAGLGLSCALLMAAQLSACGGGGSDGDDDNPPPPPPAKVSLTFQGVVTDGPIANAAVTVRVGDETFTGTADASGAYSVEAEIDEADTGAFVTLQAQGAGAQSFVQFTSLAGSFASLQAQAGSEGTLGNAENFATQITNVSTAEAALLVEANGGDAVASDAALAELATRINAQEVLDLATAIKLAVDDSANYPLPEGVDSIAELLSDATRRSDFVAAAAEQSPETFQATQTAIAGDPALNQPVAAADVPANVTAALLSSEAGFTFNFINRVDSYDFEQDGTGSLASGSFNTAFTWVVDGSSLELSYPEPVETVSFDIEQCGEVTGQVEAHYQSSGASLSRLSARTLAITETSTITYPGCPSLEPRTVTRTSARTVLVDDDFVVLTNADIADTTQTFYVYDAGQQRVVAEIADVNANGTGSTRLTGLDFTWVLDADGAVDVSFSDGSSGYYRVLGHVDAFVDDLFYELDTADGLFVDAGPSIDVDPAFAVDEEIDPAAIPGRYYQFGVGNEQDPAEGVKGFRLRFDAGNTGAQEDDALIDGQVQTFDETDNPAVALRWSLEFGGIVARRSYNFVTDSYNCIGGTENCVVFDERIIIPLVDNDAGRFYVIEVRRTDNNGVDAADPYTALARYYDYEAPASLQARSAAAAAAPGKKKASQLRGPQLH